MEVEKGEVKDMKKTLKSFELQLIVQRIQLINWDNFLKTMQ